MVFIQKWNRLQFFLRKKIKDPLEKTTKCLKNWIYIVCKYLRKKIHPVIFRAHSFPCSSFFVFPFHYFPISFVPRFSLFPFRYFFDFDELLYQILNTYCIFPSSISSKSWSMEVLLDLDPVLLSSECLDPSMIFLFFSSNFEPLSIIIESPRNKQSRMKIVSKVHPYQTNICDYNHENMKYIQDMLR